MHPSMRYAVATLVGLAAGGLAFLAADTAVESTLAGLVAALNLVVWTGFVAQYVPTYRRFDGVPGSGSGGSSAVAAKWGGLAGLAASVGVSGTSLALFPVVPGWYVASVGLFVFGLALWTMAVGMGVVVDRVSRGDDSGHANAGD